MNAVATALQAPPCTVLCVDDEPNILSALKRALRSTGCRILTAEGGRQAIESLSIETIDLVISDMRMPGMDGAQLLEQVSTRWPHIVRILLTGHADMNAAIAAINRGRIFRYLNKPWDDDELRNAVDQGLTVLTLKREKERLEALTQHQNTQLREANTLLEQKVCERTAELSRAHEEIHRAHEKLKRNYLTSIKVFSGLMELRGGRIAGHGRRVADTSRKIARAMGRTDDETQQIFVAALLHDIGFIGVPDAVLAKSAAHYSPEDLIAYHAHPVIGEQSLMPLDDMQPAAALIRMHHERYDGQGFPDARAGADIPVGARIIAVADMYDDLLNGYLADASMTAGDARTLMRHARGNKLDPEALDVFLQLTEPERVKSPEGVLVGSAALEPDMVLARDLISAKGVLMLTAGHRLTPSLIHRIRDFERREGGKLDIHVKPRTAA
jgi:response regulator RpfG family c-di-GMP phosphodiesterase